MKKYFAVYKLYKIMGSAKCQIFHLMLISNVSGIWKDLAEYPLFQYDFFCVQCAFPCSE